MKTLFTILLILLCSLVFAQPYKNYKIFEGDTINRVDAMGKKQKYFILFGEDVPNAKGFAANQKVEEGKYKDNRKVDLWKKYYVNGKLRSEIEFRSGRPSGKYITYYDNGKIEEQGTWLRNRQKDEFKRFHKNGKLAQSKVFNAKGKTEGTVEYYYDNGKPALVYSSVDGKESGEVTWYYPNGDVKRKANMTDGKLAGEVKEFKRKNPPVGEEVTAVPEDDVIVKMECGATSAGGMNKNGYNRLMNDNGQLCMVGEFKGGRLWDGKWYKYDKNGLMLKIERYKNGKYIGDTVMDE